MTIQPKIDTAKNANETLMRLLPFERRIWEFIQDMSGSLFAKILARVDLTFQQKEKEIDIVTTGIFVLAITHHQARYAGLKSKSDYQSPYLWYPARGSHYKEFYYLKSFDEVLKISGIIDTLELEQFKTDPNIQDELMVLAVGNKIMNGELPFSSGKFKEIVDKHTPHCLASYGRFPGRQAELQREIEALKLYLDEIAIKINRSPPYYYTSFILNETVNTGYPVIEKIFHDALNAAFASNERPGKKKFIDGLKTLKRETLDNFSTNKSNFDFDNCVNIANRALFLATKVGLNAVTPIDVEQFISSTQKYKACCNVWALALAVIIGAVIGMVAGAAVGFVVGDVPGAVIGALSGFVAGGLTAGVSFTMWHREKQSLNKMASVALQFDHAVDAPSIIHT